VATGRRLVPAEEVAAWEDELRGAAAAAVEQQFGHVRANLAREGIHLPDALAAAGGKKRATSIAKAAALGVTAWNAAQWNAAVMKHVAPVAKTVAARALAVAQAAVPSAGTWGLPDTSATYAAGLVAAAMASGAYVGARLNDQVAGAADPAQAASDVMDTASDIVAGQLGRASEAVSNAASYDVASYYASYLGQTGVTHTWNAVGDEKTRPEHLDADGQEVGLSDPFTVGGEQLDYPGDPAGSDWNILNCRCWTTTDGIDPAIAVEGEPADLDTATGLENTTNRIGTSGGLPALPRSYPN
jgi:hypothetical protein